MVNPKSNVLPAPPEPVKVPPAAVKFAVSPRIVPDPVRVVKLVPSAFNEPVTLKVKAGVLLAPEMVTLAVVTVKVLGLFPIPANTRSASVAGEEVRVKLPVYMPE